MKKIMFNDRYGLTSAVLDGRKTQTRRIAFTGKFKRYVNCGFYMEGKDKGKLSINDGNEIVAKSTYKIGEVVAVAQPYYKIPLHPLSQVLFESTAGWGNKMFVKSSLMPHQIKITNIRAERLKSISVEDCMKEGIGYSHHEGCEEAYAYDSTGKSDVEKWWFSTPVDAFSALIVLLYGVDTWISNPLVFVYDFELVK